MTTQTNLGLIWAFSGGVTDPGDNKYAQGWISEIPTYQNFNFVLQNTTKNLLVLAEKGSFDWQDDIQYDIGTSTRYNGFVWYSRGANINEVPVPGGTGGNWASTPTYAETADVYAKDPKYGMHIGVGEELDNTLWARNGLTILGRWLSSFSLGTLSDQYDNVTIANVRGTLVAKITSGSMAVPDHTSLLPVPGNNSYKIFHEGEPPTQEDVEGTIPDAPNDGRIYGRILEEWAEVAVTTFVGTHPPAPTEGTGSLWFNLTDGRLYIDLFDGASAQWAPASPTYTLDMSNWNPDYTGMTTEEKLAVVGLTISELQYALGL